MVTTDTRLPEIAAEICLYGSTNAGWLARTRSGRMFGTGDPVEGRSFTEAVWLAVDAITAELGGRGQVAIFAPGGERMAIVDIARRVPTFGDMSWQRAPVYTISAAELERAAAEQGNL